MHFGLFPCLTVLLGMMTVGAAGNITGNVRDSSGAAVHNAEVLLATPGMAVVATARSDADGRFTIVAPVPGRYLLIVRAPAFGEFRQAVTVDGSSSDPISIVLQIGGFEEEVTVSAIRDHVDSLRVAAQPVNVITAEEIAERVQTVVAQAVQGEAGVQLQRTSPTMAGIFVRGLTGNKVNVFIDGVRYSNGAQRGGVNTFLDLIEPEALATIEVLRGPSSAQYGSDALGGSIHFFSKPPSLGVEGSPRWGGTGVLSTGTGHRYGGGAATVAYRGNGIGVTGTFSGRSVGRIRTGDGVDSHAAVTRFLGVASDVLMDDRLPDTGFGQVGGVARANWMLNGSTSLVASYQRTFQDGGDRYDQLLGGDGNLISELNGLSLDLFSARVERLNLGPFEHAALTYSINSQREERVNQGGNGNPTATIGYEPERTTVNGVHGALTSQLSQRQTLTVGGDVYFEKLTSEAFNVNPVSNAVSPRRPRVPDGATFRQGGVYAQTAYEAMPDRVRVVGSLRFGGASYEARAADSPIVNGAPLWPDDSLGVSDVTFRAAAVMTPDDTWTIVGSVSRGFRAPHMTDLGTLGLTGSGFEVAAPDVAGLNGTVGTTADATAVSTGDPVEQVGPETSMQYEAVLRFRRPAVRTEIAFFVNNVHDNIQKLALILPPGAVGLDLARPARDLPERQRCRVRGRHHGSGTRARQLRRRPYLGYRAQPRCADHSRGDGTLRLHVHAREGRQHRASPEHRRRHTRTTDLVFSALHAAGTTLVARAVRERCVETDALVVARSWRSPHRLRPQPHLDPGILPERRARAGMDVGGIGRSLQHGGRHADCHRRNAGADSGSRARHRRELVVALSRASRLRCFRDARGHAARHA